MNIKEVLHDLRSVDEAKLIAKAIIEQPKLFPKLWEISTTDWKKSWRGAWIIDHMHTIDPSSIQTILHDLPRATLAAHNDGQLRIFLKLIACYPIPKNTPDEFMQFCFDILETPTQPVAIRVNAMQVLFNYTQLYPELKDELAAIIEFHMTDSSSGFKSKGKKLLTHLRKL